MSRDFTKTLTIATTLLVLISNSPQAFSDTANDRTESVYSNFGMIALTINDDGFLGNGFSSYSPSCEYPVSSGVEHLYFAGLWVGARNPDGSLRVSTSAEDASGISGLNEIREFRRSPIDNPPYLNAFNLISNLQNNENYDPLAKAPFHLNSIIDDYYSPEGEGHVPLGIRVELKALAWSTPYLDDFVILDYSIINTSGHNLSDLYIGYYNDTTVGNVNVNNPYDPSAPVGWNYYDDLNSAWRPGDLPDDPQIWMMQEHDADGDDGMATSWIGCRLLGSSGQPEPEPGDPPVSYNAWSFRHVPQEDDWYFDPDDPETPIPGKYQLMGNGNFDVGVTPEGDFTQPGNRMALLSTGPFPHLAFGDTLHVALAIVCGDGEDELLANSRSAKMLYSAGYAVDFSAVGETLTKPSRFTSNTPNPFNPVTRLAFILAQDGQTRVSVYDLQGQHVSTLVDAVLAAGEHSVLWDGRDDTGTRLGSGVYLVRLENAGIVDSQKIVLVK